MSRQAQNIKPVQDANTPPNVIANTARFNTQFNRGLIKHSKYKMHQNMDQHMKTILYIITLSDQVMKLMV